MKCRCARMTHNLRKSCRELRRRNIAAAHAVRLSGNVAKVPTARFVARSNGNAVVCADCACATYLELYGNTYASQRW
jgi:hypothetical protein